MTIDEEQLEFLSLLPSGGTEVSNRLSLVMTRDDKRKKSLSRERLGKRDLRYSPFFGQRSGSS